MPWLSEAISNNSVSIFDSWLFIFKFLIIIFNSIRCYKESKKGRMADALALGGDEGRDKLR